MAVPANTLSPWPARAAYVAATIFVLASGATNCRFGWDKGTDLISSTIWAAVAAAVAVVFALSWPALIRALEQKRVSAAAIALCALVLSGAFNIASALGAASAGRVQAGTEERDTLDARNRAQAAYEAARVDLSRLPASRPIGELEALQAAAQRAPQRYGCAAVNGSLRLSCPGIDSELARARQRERFEAALNKASADLAALRPTRPANQDAKTIARYMSAIGMDIGTERLNDLLVLLTVLMLEAGGGMCLALAMALSPPAIVTERPHFRGADDAVSDRPHATAEEQAAPTILQWLEGQGGKATTSIRRLADALGRSPSSMHAELKRLVKAGAVVMKSSNKGTDLAIRRH